MPKTKCIICKAQNCMKEMNKHLNSSTVFNTKNYLDKLKNKQDLDTICEDHRNPLRFNVEVINLFTSWNKIHALAMELDRRGQL